MKKFAFIFIMTAVLSSCSTVYFDNIQPSDGTILTEIPQEIIGEWNVEDGNLLITSNSVTLIDKKNKLNEKEEEKTVESYFISDSFIVKQAGKFLVFNLRVDSLWSIFIVSKTATNKIEIYRPYINEKKILKTNLKVIEDPTDSENKNEYDVITSGQVTSKQIKKIIDKNDKFIFYKKGTSKSIKR